MSAITRLGDEFPSLMAEVTEAVWPWATRQRWCPCPTGEEYLRVGISLLQLGEPSKEGRLAWILVVRLDDDGPLVQIPLVAVPRTKDKKDEDGEGSADPSNVVGAVEEFTLLDGVAEPLFWGEWARQATIVSGERDDLVEAAAAPKPMGVEQSNTSVFLSGGEKPLVAKVFRVLHLGSHPEVELPKALTEHGFHGVPQLHAFWDLDVAGGETCTAVVSEGITRATDGFDHFVNLAGAGEDPKEDAALLGETVAQMHQGLEETLGSHSSIPVVNATQRVLCSLPNVRLAAPHVEDPEALDVLVPKIRGLMEELPVSQGKTWKTTRVHGDLHLGQTLFSGDRWVVLDFEGEPLRPLEERVTPDTPMRDVAGMLRSFDYALQKAGSSDAAWLENAREAFLDGYLEGAPITADDLALLTALEMEKAIYEVAYEATFRPDRLPVPLSALDALVDRAEGLIAGEGDAAST